MSVERFKGENGWAFIGAGDSIKQTADIHLYNSESFDTALAYGFKIEDIVAAVNALPGVTATYSPPEPPLPELPKALGSTVAPEDDPWLVYVRVGPDAWYSPAGRLYTDAAMGGEWLRKATIKEGPGA